MLTFTAARTDDPTAAALLTRYFSEREETFPSAQGTYSVSTPDPDRFVPPSGAFLLAELDGEPVGCGGVRRIDDLQRPNGSPIVQFEVKHLFLSPAARGKGVGRALLNELERRARAMGASRLVLDTNESLAAAGNLYRTSGYVTVEPYNDNPNATHWYAKDVEPA
ncbi:GNAT family N-acetyltransferase [Planctomonas sp. JC2975]|uniref:GNAT family N-acetyltransferase n=1 Tax=Planctomonas sp. JC2975 TaxID=2729626 RepID=UPI001475D8DE|nr:GNAT family N-acetyltransferase [Planctomonas sp. JC2975]NNC13346.1 GNAT family N-acetyltransferase [Planctomonas sp. JC2975]